MSFFKKRATEKQQDVANSPSKTSTPIRGKSIKDMEEVLQLQTMHNQEIDYFQSLQSVADQITTQKQDPIISQLEPLDEYVHSVKIVNSEKLTFPCEFSPVEGDDSSDEESDIAEGSSAEYTLVAGEFLLILARQSMYLMSIKEKSKVGVIEDLFAQDILKRIEDLGKLPIPRKETRLPFNVIHSVELDNEKDQLLYIYFYNPKPRKRVCEQISILFLF